MSTKECMVSKKKYTSHIGNKLIYTLNLECSIQHNLGYGIVPSIDFLFTWKTVKNINLPLSIKCGLVNSIHQYYFAAECTLLITHISFCVRFILFTGPKRIQLFILWNCSSAMRWLIGCCVLAINAFVHANVPERNAQ